LSLDLVAVRQRLFVHAIRGFVALFTVFQLPSRTEQDSGNASITRTTNSNRQVVLTPLTLDVSEAPSADWVTVAQTSAVLVTTSPPASGPAVGTFVGKTVEVTEEVESGLEVMLVGRT
jgi:hypothetical protein